MLKLLSGLITLPIVLIIVLFAITNRQPVSYELWPLPSQVTTYGFLWVLVPLVLGVLIGGTAMWLSAGRWRKLARTRGLRLRAADEELRRLRDRQAKADEAATREAERARAEAAGRAAGEAAARERAPDGSGTPALEAPRSTG